jgi:hypothetical protein
VFCIRPRSASSYASTSAKAYADADAVSVGVAALTAPGLRGAAVEEAVIALRALVEHRDDIVRTRTQTVNRLHVLLTQLLPGGAPRQLTADTAAGLLRAVRPRCQHYLDRRSPVGSTGIGPAAMSAAAGI